MEIFVWKVWSSLKRLKNGISFCLLVWALSFYLYSCNSSWSSFICFSNIKFSYFKFISSSSVSSMNYLEGGRLFFLGKFEFSGNSGLNPLSWILFLDYRFLFSSFVAAKSRNNGISLFDDWLWSFGLDSVPSFFFGDTSFVVSKMAFTKLVSIVAFFSVYYLSWVDSFFRSTSLLRTISVLFIMPINILSVIYL